METAPQQVEKPKRAMSQEQLKKLAHARDLALKKRREMAAARAVDREALVLEKISAKKARDNKRAEIEAERRAALDTTPPTPTPTVDAPKPSTAVSGASITTKPKKRAVVVETSDSSDSEGFIDNARVFIVKRERSKMVNVESAQPGASTATTAPPTPPDPHEDLYARMFGR